ncbi:MAG: GNAT family N-acetyltransferase, partial [Vicinamibacteria bacterium]
MKEPTLRPAAPGDIAALLALQSTYYAEDRYAFVESMAREGWHSLLSDANLGSAWVFEADSTLVGYVVLTLGYSLEYRGRDAFLDELYVTPDWRGRGLGRRALEVVDSACSRLGVNALHLEVENDKSGAIALYRKWGFAEHRRVLMTKEVT